MLDLDSVAAVLIVLGLILIVLFMIFVGVPLLIFLIESLLIIPIAVVAGVFGRVFLGRPWTLEAENGGPSPRRVVWNVVGWGASERAAAQMAGMIKATGGVPEEPVFGRPRARRRSRR
jgi:hypothetical protein